MSRPRLSRVCGLLLALWTMLGLVQPASAQKAAIVTAVRSGESAWWQYVKQKIVSTGLYTAVDQIDSAFSDPTLTQLQNYKLVVILSSDYGLSSADGVGNALGDYMAMVPGAAVLVFQPELAAARGWRFDTALEDVCPLIALPDTFEGWLAMLDGKERRETQRKLRRASEETRVTYTTDGARLDADVEAFIQLMKASTYAKSGFMTARMERYFHAICRAMFDAGRLQLAFLEVEGQRAPPRRALRAISGPGTGCACCGCTWGSSLPPSPAAGACCRP